MSRVKNPSGLAVAGFGEGDAADKKAKYTKEPNRGAMQNAAVAPQCTDYLQVKKLRLTYV